jgi:hypothetical protein
LGAYFCFVDHKVDKNDADDAETAPDEEHFGLEVAVSGSLAVSLDVLAWLTNALPGPSLTKYGVE